MKLPTFFRAGRPASRMAVARHTAVRVSPLLARLVLVVGLALLTFVGAPTRVEGHSGHVHNSCEKFGCFHGDCTMFTDGMGVDRGNCTCDKGYLYDNVYFHTTAHCTLDIQFYDYFVTAVVVLASAYTLFALAVWKASSGIVRRGVVWGLVSGFVYIALSVAIRVDKGFYQKAAFFLACTWVCCWGIALTIVRAFILPVYAYTKKPGEAKAIERRISWALGLSGLVFFAVAGFQAYYCTVPLDDPVAGETFNRTMARSMLIYYVYFGLTVAFIVVWINRLLGVLSAAHAAAKELKMTIRDGRPSVTSTLSTATTTNDDDGGDGAQKQPRNAHEEKRLRLVAKLRRLRRWLIMLLLFASTFFVPFPCMWLFYGVAPYAWVMHVLGGICLLLAAYAPYVLIDDKGKMVQTHLNKLGLASSSPGRSSMLGQDSMTTGTTPSGAKASARTTTTPPPTTTTTTTAGGGGANELEADETETADADDATAAVVDDADEEKAAAAAEEESDD